jgi:hypothetical protein
MRIVLSAAVAAIVLASGAPVYALSVTNRDGTDQKVTITEGEKQREEVIATTKTLSNVCPAGCVIQLQNGEEYEFDGNEIVSIEEGLMFLDEPAQEEVTDGQKASPGAAAGAVNGAAPPAAQAQTPAQSAAQTLTPTPPTQKK